MNLDDYKTKEHVSIVYTGEGKGKTSASLGLMVRGLGKGWRVAYIQFIKHWEVNEHKFIDAISTIYKDDLLFFKGGKGFYDAGDMSAKNVTEDQHKQAAIETLAVAKKAITDGYDLVICDEVNNAVNDGLLKVLDLEELFKLAAGKTNLCVTGRDFPESLLNHADIATNMTKMKHHFDDKFLANEGIDY